MTAPVVIGLGGNVGGESAVRARFVRAREALAQLGALRSAALYRTVPIELPRDPSVPRGPAPPVFLNTAVRVAFEGQPGELLATVQEIERLLGRARERETRWGPRTIDLDVLVWGDRRLDAPELEVPHPRLAERRFALAPLVDVLGEDFVIPGRGAAGVLLRQVAAQGCEQIAEAW